VKINIARIVQDHISTLYDARTGKLSYTDLAIFLAIPALFSAISFIRNFSVKAEFYNVSITFFGIFIALLLNIQVAIFAIFQRKWDRPTDRKLADIQEIKINERNLILRELNANVSYLVLFCCVTLLASVVFYALSWTAWLAPAVIVLLYCHFFLTLIMIVKRSHALFQMEYGS
jgi:hypothetical protein